ncbi:MAG: acyl carrier protein [Anaerofustis stercorihominis]|nr:acyl carrier protein [Anaerofustis stercorihominis]
MSVKEKVKEILKEVKPTKNLEDITDIAEGGYLDSFEIMMLISLLSEAFAIEVPVDSIIPENFNSVDSITAMVESLQ